MHYHTFFIFLLLSAIVVWGKYPQGFQFFVTGARYSKILRNNFKLTPFIRDVIIGIILSDGY